MARWSRQIFANPDAALRKEVTRIVREERPRPRKIPAGSVVEFIRDSGLSCGVVWPHPANGSRYLILDQRGHQSWMLRKRFQHVSNATISTSRRQHSVNELHRIDERREAEVRELDMATLWEVVRGTSGTRGWTLAELAGLLLGDDRLDSSHAVLLRALWSRNWFERKGVLWHALDSAVISRRQQAADDGRKREQELEQLAAWVLAEAAGGQSASQSVNRERAISLLREVALTAESELDPNSDAAQLMSRAHQHGSRAAFDLLVGLGHWSAQEDLRLHRRGIPVKFDGATLADAVRITDPEICWLPQARHCRRWWRRPWGFSVPAEADNCSRAFSVRRTCRLETRLTIFVAVPALLVNEQGPVDSEARLRGTSLSLPDRHIGLFPAEIVTATGFVEGEWKPAIAVDISLSDDLEPRSVHLSLRRVRCHVIDAPTDPPGSSPWTGPLAALSAWAQRLRSKRLERAIMPAVAFPQVKVAEGELLIDPGIQTSAQFIDEELMHLAASAVGRWCRDQGVPCIYSARSAAANRDGEGGLTAAARERLPALIRHYHLRRHLTRSSLQTEPGAEQSLGIDLYARFARPLDSYDDLTMQRQIISMIVDSRPAYEEGDLRQRLAGTASAREAASAALGEARRYWALKALELRAGEELEAIVVERAGLGYSVVIPLVGCRAYVPVRREMWANPGDSLTVRIEQVSAQRDVLMLSVDERLQRPSTDVPSYEPK